MIKYRYELIQDLINKNNYESYLEIGIRHKTSFNEISINNKTSVDPDINYKATHSITSDEFFKENKKTFDIVFIDGLHVYEQVYRDIINSLKFLNENGTIVCHDMNPLEEIYQNREPKHSIWNGDCWKAWIRLRSERDDLNMFVINIDHGCGVIKNGKQEKLKNIDITKDLTWVNFNKNRINWLNLIKIDKYI